MKPIKLSISNSQEYLLRTLIGDDKDSPLYYKKWIDSVNVEEYIDSSSYRLLPMLYKRLVFLKIDDVNLNRYKGIYKKSFFKNSIHFHNLYSIGRELNREKIPFTLIKGLALIICYEIDTGIRTMSDIDIVVDKEDIQKTVLLLKKIGFSSDDNYDISKNLALRHAFSFSNKNGFEIDLNWTPNSLARIDIELKDKKTVQYKNISLNVLSAENQILTILIHATSWNPVFTIRWITDINTILKNESRIDWEYILSILTRTRLSYSSFLMFEYFNTVSGIKIPDRVIAALKSKGANKEDYVFAKKTLLHPKTIFGKLNWFSYSINNRDKNLLVRLIGFPKNILMRSKYNNYSELFSAFIKKYIFK